jgi:hypothetical protein
MMWDLSRYSSIELKHYFCDDFWHCDKFKVSKETIVDLLHHVLIPKAAFARDHASSTSPPKKRFCFKCFWQIPRIAFR